MEKGENDTAAQDAVAKDTAFGRKADDIVTLDVGGTILRTARSTLTKDPDSMLARMFARPDLRASDAFDAMHAIERAHFIDCDPAYFSCVLNYLRYGTVILSPGCTVGGLQVVAAYFCMQGLHDECDGMSRADTVKHELEPAAKAKMLKSLWLKAREAKSGSYSLNFDERHHQLATEERLLSTLLGLLEEQKS